jgi:hypothetical protein
MSRTNPLDFWKELQDLLTDRLDSIQKEETKFLSRLIKSRDFSIGCLEELDKFNCANALTAELEIHFYKAIKPIFWSQVIFFDQAFQLELSKPPGGPNDLISYYKNELDRLKEYYDENRFIYRYIRSGSNYLDDKIFIKTSKAEKTILPEFSTLIHGVCPMNFDYIVSKIKANELLETHLVLILDDLQNPGQHGVQAMPNLTWTDSKTGLIELAYGLQSAGVLNNGKVELKEIIDFLQIAFHINLGHYPRTFQEILSRKTGYTNFIDKLRDKLLLRIQNIEEKYDR